MPYHEDIGPMVSTKMPGEETKLSRPPSYPDLPLEGKVLDKLGFKELPQVGTMLIVHAKTKVTRASQTENDKSICLSITNMSIEVEKEKTKPAEDVLYSEKKEEK